MFLHFKQLQGVKRMHLYAKLEQDFVCSMLIECLPFYPTIK